ncbi:MAG: hypothetical protein FD123_2832 [Bacteroidetes bacterium]|nr:MAG: hypothetical protein FD123_2832 [Bacteroidota bacterium]
MTTAHLHLLLNHFPIIGTVIALFILAFGFILKNNTLKLAAGYILFMMALIAIPLPATGEAAEELVENVPGVSEAVIEVHEEAGMLALWIMEITGVAALLAIILDRLKKTAAKPVFVLTLFLSAAAFSAMARTGYLGGQIRHSQTAGATTVPQDIPAGAKEDDD